MYQIHMYREICKRYSIYIGDWASVYSTDFRDVLSSEVSNVLV